MMSRMTASNGCVPTTSMASRPPEHFVGTMPSMRSRVSTSSAMSALSSTIRMRGLVSTSDMASASSSHKNFECVHETHDGGHQNYDHHRREDEEDQREQQFDLGLVRHLLG